MGVLEDAIRQHLELKRAHGASDEEVEREATEALGLPGQGAPAESEVASEAAAAAPVEPVDGAEPVPFDSEVDEAPADLEISEPPAFEAEPEPHPAEPEPVAAEFEPPPAEPEPEAFVEQTDPMIEPEPEPEPEPEAISFDEEEPGVAPPMPESGESEDVLEDTPEFLQDTPEHDRLWFEQKPPRDFDFD